MKNTKECKWTNFSEDQAIENTLDSHNSDNNTNEQQLQEFRSDTLKSTAFRSLLHCTIQDLWKQVITKRKERLAQIIDQQSPNSSLFLSESNRLIPTHLDTKTTELLVTESQNFLCSLLETLFFLRTYGGDFQTRGLNTDWR